MLVVSLGKALNEMAASFVRLCSVYTCRFDNQVTNEKLVKKYFLVVKFALDK